MSFDWFHVMYSMAAVFMIIEFFWKILLVPLAMISVIFNERARNAYIYLISLIPYYFMATYSALIGLGVNHGQKSTSTLIIGGVFLLLTGAYGIADQQRQAMKEYDYATYRFASYKYYGLIAACLFYIYTIFKINIAVNDITIWVTDKLTWIQDLPFLGIGIAVVAFLYVIYMIFVMVTAVLSLLMALFSRNSNSVNG